MTRLEQWWECECGKTVWSITALSHVTVSRRGVIRHALWASVARACCGSKPVRLCTRMTFE